MPKPETRTVSISLIQASGDERYAKLQTEIVSEGRVIAREIIDLSIEDVGRLVCGIPVRCERRIVAVKPR